MDTDFRRYDNLGYCRLLSLLTFKSYLAAQPTPRSKVGNTPTNYSRVVWQRSRHQEVKSAIRRQITQESILPLSLPLKRKRRKAVNAL
jgi:hypothetical protein